MRRSPAARAMRRWSGDVVDQMPAMMISLAGPRHLIRTVNAALRDFVGRSDLIGVPLAAALPGSPRASRYSNCSTACMRPASRPPAMSGGCRSGHRRKTSGRRPIWTSPSGPGGPLTARSAACWLPAWT